MLARYVFADLTRNPRRTLATVVGVVLGVGLFCGVLFFVDGLSASMTQRAVAPLPIDMQRIISERVGGVLNLEQRFDRTGRVAAGEQVMIELEMRNPGDVPANEVTVRSVPGAGLVYVAGSAVVDGIPIEGFEDNPFDHGPAQTGFNLGSVESGGIRRISYLVGASADVVLGDEIVQSTISSRESVKPSSANQPPPVPLDQLIGLIGGLDGVAYAGQLSLADLGSGTITAGGLVAPGPAKIFGFDRTYADRDPTINIISGGMNGDGALLSAEAARALGVAVGDSVSVRLPDGSALDIDLTGITDLTGSRSLFASRRGGDLEAFVYVRNSIVVSPGVFADRVLPAYERAATERGDRLKSPPVREVDIRLDRERLDADPSTALVETQRIGAEVTAVAAYQDFLLDNISNTLTVASADAAVAKRLFVFLGVPGALLAAMLAAYAGTVLAEGQRREQATLRVRGAGRGHLLRMLTLRTGLLTAAGSAAGLALGYGAAAAILGHESIQRASLTSLIMSALVGTVGGFLATGSALYVTGRRSIEREINEDRARHVTRPPLWRRARLDVIGLLVVAVGTVVALRAHAFDGEAGSVYFGRGVRLHLAVLVLPIAVWITGSLLAARLFGSLLSRGDRPAGRPIGRPLPSLYRLSIGRRPWSIGNGAIVVSLIVALATSLAAFTASYDAAKTQDARYATGSDIRISPSPASNRTYGTGDAHIFETDGVAGATPVIYSVYNAIVRSARTSDPVNLAAIDPDSYAAVAPIQDADFVGSDGRQTLATLRDDPTAILLSADMAAFLEAKMGDPLDVLLARGTDEQVEVRFHITGIYERLPGFPDGAKAAISIDEHARDVPGKLPDFYLAAAATSDDAGLQRAVTSLQDGPGAVDALLIETRATTLARDQSSLAALNIAGLVDLDSAFALSMAAVTIAIFVFGLLLQRRREYVTLRAQGLEPGSIRLLIAAEAATVAIAGSAAGVVVGAAMGYYFVTVLRPLFVLSPAFTLPLWSTGVPVALVFVATAFSAVGASRLVNQLDPTELLRDE